MLKYLLLVFQWPDSCTFFFFNFLSLVVYFFVLKKMFLMSHAKGESLYFGEVGKVWYPKKEESGIYHWINHSWSFSPYVSMLTQKINDAALEKGGFDCEPLVACLVWKGGRWFLKMLFWHPKSVTHLLPQLRWRDSLLQQRTKISKGKRWLSRELLQFFKYIFLCNWKIYFEWSGRFLLITSFVWIGLFC